MMMLKNKLEKSGLPKITITLRIKELTLFLIQLTI